MCVALFPLLPVFLGYRRRCNNGAGGAGGKKHGVLPDAAALILQRLLGKDSLELIASAGDATQARSLVYNQNND